MHEVLYQGNYILDWWRMKWIKKKITVSIARLSGEWVILYLEAGNE